MASQSTSPRRSVIALPEEIPLFPLPNVVFFPGTYLPLHIFEPRYREMVKDTAASGHCIGMALLKEGWEEQYEESPPIFETGCVGRLVSIEKLSDGCYHILLYGLQRCVYQEQPKKKSYRTAKFSCLADSGPETLTPTVRSSLLEVTMTYLRSKDANDLCATIASKAIEDAILVQSLSAGLDLTPLEKQFLLESTHLHQQARRLIDLIRFQLADRSLYKK